MLILQINAAGLSQERILELKLLIETFNIDVACVNETHLKPHSPFSFPGFKIYRFDRPGTTRKGGVLVLVKENIESEDLGSASIDQAEIQMVKIKINNNKSLKLATAYCLPKTILSENAINFIGPKATGFMLCGDLNAKHELLGCSGRPDQAGEKVVEMMQRYNLKQLTNGDHTFTSWKGRLEILDLFVASEDIAKLVTGIESLPDIGSDHLPVAVELRGQGQRPKNYPEIRLNLNATNWDAFADKMSDLCNNWDTSDITNTTKIDEAADTIGELFEEAMLIIPRTSATGLKPWKPSKEILAAIKQRRAARRYFERVKTSFARRAYHQASARSKKLIKLARLGRFKYRCEQLSKLLKDKPRLFWKEFSCLSTNNASSDRRNYPPITGANGQACYTDLDKAETFAKHLHENVWVNEDDPSFCKGTAELVKRTLDRNKRAFTTAPEPRKDSSGIWSVTAEELQRLAQNLKTTAPGEDGISNAILKKAPLAFWKKFADVCNASLKLGHIPRKWKSAVVVLIAKEGKDWTSVKGYRPISLLSALAKMLERVVARRLLKEMRRRKILPDTQSAFLGDHGVEDHPFRVSQKGVKGLLDRKVTIMSCLDVEGAFDKIWHDGLRYKTYDQGLPEIPTSWISNFLDDRTFCVRIGLDHSAKYAITGGVPQGSPLSPLLYLLFTADLPRVIPSHTDKGVFADDLALISTHEDEEVAIGNMNESLHNVKQWFDKWRLKLNAQKSQTIRFSNKRKPPPKQVMLGNQSIQFVKEVKYLGVIFDEKLLFKRHFLNVLERVKKRMTALKSVCRRRFHIGSQAAIIVYKAYIRPIMTFGCPAWVGADQSSLDKLEVQQNRAIRIAFKLPPWSNVDETRKQAEMASLVDNIFETATNWLARSLNANNLAGKEARQQMTNLDIRVYQNSKRMPLTAMIQRLDAIYER